MKPNFPRGFAAVLDNGVCAGTIASRNGRANVTPAPCMKVRRDRCFLVMNIWAASVTAWRTFVILHARDDYPPRSYYRYPAISSLASETVRSSRHQVPAMKSCNSDWTHL